MKSYISVFLTLACLFFCTNAVILKCTFNGNIDMYSAICNDFIDTGKEQLESLQGEHKENRSESEVTYLTIQIASNMQAGQNLTFVPKAIAKVLPNLVNLMIYARAYEITAESLNGLNKLEYFYSTNPFKHLPGDLFKGTPNLKQLNIMSTNYMVEGLESIGANLLGNLTKLQYTMFYGKCIMESTMSRLQILNLNQFLHVLCPSDEKIDSCPVGCADTLTAIQRENDELKSRILDLEKVFRPECNCKSY